MRGAEGVPTARSLRRQSTKAERRLWSAVRDRRLGGFKFRRRDRRLSNLGIGMLRFWNHQVMNSKTAVLFDSRTS